MLSHHAGVEVLVHAAEGVGRHLALAGQQQGDVGHAQRVEGLGVQGAPVGEEDALSDRPASGAQVGRAAVGRGLDHVPALFRQLLALIQHPGRTGGG